MLTVYLDAFLFVTASSDTPLSKFRDYNIDRWEGHDILLRTPAFHVRTRTSMLWARVSPFLLILLVGCLSLYSATHTIMLRHELRSITDHLQASEGDHHLSGDFPVAGISTSEPTSKSMPTENLWWSAAVYSEPTSASAPKDWKGDVPHDLARDDGSRVLVDLIPPSEGQSASTTLASDSGHLPAVYVPFSWPLPHVEYEEVRRQVAAGWDRVWRVLEIMLHWPLPVPRTRDDI